LIEAPPSFGDGCPFALWVARHVNHGAEGNRAGDEGFHGEGFALPIAPASRTFGLLMTRDWYRTHGS
jgi:hypothetical protein